MRMHCVFMPESVCERECVWERVCVCVCSGERACTCVNACAYVGSWKTCTPPLLPRLALWRPVCRDVDVNIDFKYKKNWRIKNPRENNYKIHRTDRAHSAVTPPGTNWTTGTPHAREWAPNRWLKKKTNDKLEEPDFYLILFTGFDSNLCLFFFFFFFFFGGGVLRHLVYCLLNVLYPLLAMLTAAPPPLSLPPRLLQPLTVLPPSCLYMCN